MTTNQTKTLTRLAILAALSVVLGYFLKLPTPTGMVTLLDVGIFFTAIRFGKREGAIVGGVTGFLIDLISGYPQWMFFSLLIHGAQGYLAGLKGKFQILGLVLASLVMVAGYAIVSAIILGHGWGAALTEILPNFSQNLVGMILGYTLHRLVPQKW
ncbi:Substrate-specific component PdxU2 of putative pyridoxin-related ECF transporter [Streptococcus sp. DD10]|uniref:ECF transporter S component n=1 Tax=Streptococcus sp. DD10 TaxID=1777878 RepID=UPI000798DAC2|nr:ECF transporter S component [Streptococcus sp. DD10]KXT72463.1 Substrate-specific component PdxU2 of putative pyridoxin-related ECF transporter [Streptococcus sp. DD10]